MLPVWGALLISKAAGAAARALQNRNLSSKPAERGARAATPAASARPTERSASDPPNGGAPFSVQQLEALFAESRRLDKAPDWAHWTPAQRDQLIGFIEAKTALLERASDAKHVLGWNGERMSEDEFNRLRKRALSLWHPDKRAAYVTSTGKPAAMFDETSRRVIDALRFVEENAVAASGHVLGW